MGQPVTVIEKPSSRPGIIRFETNRPLSGMGHERYLSADDAVDDRAVDEAARRLFASGQVASVHVNGNVITVGLVPGVQGDGLREILEGLFTYYVPGVIPPSDEELMGETAPAE